MSINTLKSTHPFLELQSPGYIDKFILFDKLIKKYKPEMHEYEYDYKCEKLKFLIYEYNTIMYIHPNSTWLEIKNNLDKISNSTPLVDKFCTVCFDKIYKSSKCDKYKIVSCTSCKNNYCLECYINLFRKGQGIIICTMCNFIHGKSAPSFLIEASVEEIRKNFDKLM